MYMCVYVNINFSYPLEPISKLFKHLSDIRKPPYYICSHYVKGLVLQYHHNSLTTFG